MTHPSSSTQFRTIRLVFNASQDPNFSVPLRVSLRAIGALHVFPLSEKQGALEITAAAAYREGADLVICQRYSSPNPKGQLRVVFRVPLQELEKLELYDAKEGLISAITNFDQLPAFPPTDG